MATTQPENKGQFFCVEHDTVGPEEPESFARVRLDQHIKDLHTFRGMTDLCTGEIGVRVITITPVEIIN